MNEEQFYKWLGEEFKKRREELKLTPAQVSRRADVNKSVLSRFEKEGKKISAFNLNKISKVLGFPSTEDVIKDSIKKKPLTLTLEGDELGGLTNSEKNHLLSDIKRFVKLLFSSEIYDELVDEFQAKADAERAAKQAKKQATPECNHEAGTSESPA